MAWPGSALIIGLLAGVDAVWQVILLLFAVGWLVTPLQAALTTIIQTEAADQVRGRVAATGQHGHHDGQRRVDGDRRHLRRPDRRARRLRG